MNFNRYRKNSSWEAPVDPLRCAANVHAPGRGIFMHQCTRKPLAGSEWCRQHSPEATEARRKAEHERYERNLAIRLAPLRRAECAEAKLAEVAALVADYIDKPGPAAELANKISRVLG